MIDRGCEFEIEAKNRGSREEGMAMAEMAAETPSHGPDPAADVDLGRHGHAVEGAGGFRPVPRGPHPLEIEVAVAHPEVQAEQAGFGEAVPAPGDSAGEPGEEVRFVAAYG